MKRFTMTCLAVLLSVSAYAETDYIAIPRVKAIEKSLGQTATDHSAVKIDTISEKTAAAGVTVDGVLLKDGLVKSVAGGTTNAPVLGPDASATLVLDYGTCTNGQVVAYTTVYGTAPQIFLTYQEDPGAATSNTVAYAASINTTNFTCNAVADKTIAWQAIGLK